MKSLKSLYAALLEFVHRTIERHPALFAGAQRAYIVPSLAELQQYNVNRPDQVEAIRQSLWDTQTYVDNSTTQLLFFQVPKGQSSKTMADTKMEAAGALPAPKSFLIQTIELYMFPGNTRYPVAFSLLFNDFKGSHSHIMMLQDNFLEAVLKTLNHGLSKRH